MSTPMRMLSCQGLWVAYCWVGPPGTLHWRWWWCGSALAKRIFGPPVMEVLSLHAHHWPSSSEILESVPSSGNASLLPKPLYFVSGLSLISSHFQISLVRTGLKDRYSGFAVSIWPLSSVWWCLRSREDEVEISTLLCTSIEQTQTKEENWHYSHACILTQIMFTFSGDYTAISLQWDEPSWRWLSMIFQVGNHPALLPQAPATDLQFRRAFVDPCWSALGNSLFWWRELSQWFQVRHKSLLASPKPL